MTIKVQLGQLYQQNEALEAILRAELPAKVAYQMAKMTRQIADEVTIIEKHRNTLIEKFGEDFHQEGHPATKKVKDENVAQFITEFNEFLNTEVEVYGNKLTIDDLDGVKITPAQMLSLDWLIEA